MQVEANPPGTYTVIAIFLCKCIMFDIENEGQSDGEQRPQWCHSMEQIKSIKDITHFYVSSRRFRDIQVLKCCR